MGNPVVHFEIGGEDVERLIDFYSTVFEWDIIPLSDQLHIADPASDKGIEGHLFQTTKEMDITNLVIIYVEVDDIQASLEQVESLGVRSSYHHKQFREMPAISRCSVIRVATASVCCNQGCNCSMHY